MSVRIIVDSASDLTKERADALNLDYMPLKTIFGETEYLDGVTISHKEFYEKLIECGTIPTTRDRKSTRLNSSHSRKSRMPSSA